MNVQNAPSGARLSAWFDWNQNGSWAEEEDFAIRSSPVSSGDNLLHVDLPATARPGVTFARFRLSTAGERRAGGFAVDGEVEDYAVTVQAALEVRAGFVKEEFATFGSDLVRSCVAADIDNDGDMDVVTARENSGSAIWYENDGNQTFSAHSLYTTRSPRKVLTSDIDYDGDVDIIVATDLHVFWFENGGNITTRRFVYTFPVELTECLDLAVGDVNSDGNIDIVTTSDLRDKIIVHYQDDAAGFTVEVVNTVDTGQPKSVQLIDLDSDGDLDILTAESLGKVSGMTVCYENTPGAWLRHQIGDSIDSVWEVSAADIDGDGDIDVAASGGQLQWHENTGAMQFVTHQINPLFNGRAVLAADLDSDGAVDIITGGQPGGWTYVHYNDSSFIKSSIESEGNDELSLVDMNQDGVLDVLPNDYAWYRPTSVRDYGDAPAPYPSAYHELTGPHLGPKVSGEQPARSDDEDDGVNFDDLRAGKAACSITVDVRSAPNGARLDAWIDWNNNGGWLETGEQIAHSVAVSEGVASLQVAVPAYAHSGPTFARFRLSSSGGLGLNDVALDGEVEDHQVIIAPPGYGGGQFVEQPTGYTGDASYLEAVDLDLDGDVDFLASDASNGQLHWLRNDGNESFVAQPLLDVLRLHKTQTVDFDRDGDLDIAVAGKDTIWWLENDGAQFTAHSVWETQASDHATNRTQVTVADFDLDSDYDLISSVQNDDIIAVHVNNGDQTFYTYSLIDVAIGASVHQPSGLHAVDIDGDQRMDLVTAQQRPYGDDVVWYSYIGYWQENVISGSGDAKAVYPGDVDGDGDLELTSAGDEGVNWHEINDPYGRR